MKLRHPIRLFIFNFLDRAKIENCSRAQATQQTDLAYKTYMNLGKLGDGKLDDGILGDGNWATENWATESWATGELGDRKIGPQENCCLSLHFLASYSINQFMYPKSDWFKRKNYFYLKFYTEPKLVVFSSTPGRSSMEDLSLSLSSLASYPTLAEKIMELVFCILTLT